MLEIDVSIQVSDVNNYIKSALENDENLRYLYVRGEISNYKIASNGAAYFTLSDENSSISCVLFSNYRKSLKFIPMNGDAVKVLASISVYPPRGTYSLRVYNIAKQGMGDALLQLEALKKKLFKEGLFDENRKRKINIFPRNIGVITANGSAAIKDIVYNIQRRFECANILFFPSSVQGDTAPKELLKAFELSQTYDLDTLIIGRGGGSSEDLSAFNDEELVRAISTSKCPVISAVGHEIDTTLIDLVADKRASTPTGAAELATIDKREIEEKLLNIDLNLKDIIKHKLENYETEFTFLKKQLDSSFMMKINELQNKIIETSKRLNDLNPMNIIKRGYSLTMDENGTIINSVSKLSTKDKIRTVLSDGEIISTIMEVRENGTKN